MNTITVRRANVELTINEDQKSYYLSKGYAVINENGDVVEEPTINDVATLQRRLVELTKENEELRKQIAELTTETPAKKATKKKE